MLDEIISGHVANWNDDVKTIKVQCHQQTCRQTTKDYGSLVIRYNPPYNYGNINI